jgi:cobalt/nickel transport system permease protein
MPPLLRPQALHLPDGFLSLPIAILFWLLTAAVIAVAARRSQHAMDERRIPLMGIMAAFIFAGQMINFPVLGGTSGHLLGGALAAVTLGPWAGILVMTAVVSVQALVYQDGGLLVLGANIFNMGIVTSLIGYGVYRAFLSRPERTRLAAAGVAAWLAVMAGAFLTALQVGFSGQAALGVILPVMLGVHALIGIGEALITTAALSFIFRTRPDVLEAGQPAGGRGWMVGGALASLAVVLFAPLASAHPDGLERVAADLGFLGTAQDPLYEIIPDYTLPLLGESAFSTIAAGVIGMALVAGGVILFSRLTRKIETT